MTDKPPETALDRLRARLVLRQEVPSPADTGSPGPEPSPAPSATAAPPQADPAPADEPAGKSGQSPPIRQAPPPRRLAASPNPADAMRETRRELSRTRIRINLTWAMAVTLISAVLVSAAYLHPSRIPDELFSSLWPWRAHVWNRYGGDVIWCINEARKNKMPFTCKIGFLTDGPDCPRPDTQDVTAAYLCPPWEKWPIDPAPRWSAEGPPQWSR